MATKDDCLNAGYYSKWLIMLSVALTAYVGYLIGSGGLKFLKH